MDKRFVEIFEPAASGLKERLKAMQKCKKEEFLTGNSYISVLLYLSGSEGSLEKMIKTANEYGTDLSFLED